ncbi:MAG: class I SAM-dependent methyltransferase [Chloroflexi bacterium]|nr:MAG: class I SAM-dependent methyltransferase [Chloroflexota bacterium]
MNVTFNICHCQASYDSAVTSTELSAYPGEGFEPRLVEHFVSLRRKRVLEIGCGDGRLTFQYAPRALSVLAIDPDRPSIDEAIFQQHARGLSNIEFRIGSIERLPRPGAPFDVALFSWSL